MTLQQEAYHRIEHMSDNDIRFFINMVDSLQSMTSHNFVMNVQYDPENDKNSDEMIAFAGKIDEEEIAKSKNMLLLSNISRYQSESDEDFVSEKVIDNTLNIIFHLSHQPELFKTGRNSLHLQFELKDNSYMEFEVFEDKVTCMIVPKRKYEDAAFPDVSLNNKMRLNEIVEEFYRAD